MNNFEFKKPDIINMIMGKMPKSITDCVNLQNRGLMEFTGNQWNPNWGWVESQLGKMDEASLFKLYKELDNSEFESPPTKELNDMLNENKIVMLGSAGESAYAIDALIKNNMRVLPCENQPAGGTKLDVEVKSDMALIKDGLSKILDEITAKEEECLRIIHTRYCIPRALKINVNDLSRLQPDIFNRPNYWEYYYRHGTQNEYFLMSREVAIINGEVKLNIAFNAELARDGE